MEHTTEPAGRPRDVLILNWRDTEHPESGGSELYVEQMARGLVARGHRVTMLCPRFPGGDRRETRDGVTYRRIGGRHTIYVLVPLLALVGRLPRHDLVVEIQNGVPFLASAFSRRPVVVVVHHVHREQWPMLFPRPVARFGWWLESWLAPRVARRSRYVTVSEATRRELVGLAVDADRIEVIHNGSPALGDMVAAARADGPELVVLGRLVPHKRVEVAIDTVAKLAADHPRLRLNVVGSGWWRDHLVDYAADRGVADRVVFHGQVDERTKHELLARSWLSLMPSVKEGWGLVVVEAGMHRTPTVAFRDAGGVQESVVHERTGLLVDGPEGFHEAVRRLMEDESLREQMGRWAEKHARGFTWEASQERFARLVERLPQRA